LKAHTEERKSEVKLASQDGGVEVYRSSQPITPSLPPPSKNTEEPPKEELEELDPIDAVIAKGKACNHRGCSKSYFDESSRKEECIYHPGVPIFHETLKKWSCCGGKAMEFDVFLSIEGCKNGLHKFVDKVNPNEQVQCRHDWYQMAQIVLVSIYAKKVKKEQSKIEFERDKVKVHLTMEDGKTFVRVFNLSEFIDPNKSMFEFLSTKVEIKLQKTTGKQWSDLERK